jgi:hypothetical protein
MGILAAFVDPDAKRRYGTTAVTAIIAGMSAAFDTGKLQEQT